MINTTPRGSDVVGVYDVVVATRKLLPFLVDDIARSAERGFERHLSEQFDGLRVDSIKVSPEYVRILLTIDGDVRKSAKAFVHSAKQKVGTEIKELHNDELRAMKVIPTLGIFGRDILVRTVGDGVSDEDLEAFLEPLRETEPADAPSLSDV